MPVRATCFVFRVARGAANERRRVDRLRDQPKAATARRVTCQTEPVVHDRRRARAASLPRDPVHSGMDTDRSFASTSSSGGRLEGETVEAVGSRVSHGVCLNERGRHRGTRPVTAPMVSRLAWQGARSAWVASRQAWVGSCSAWVGARQACGHPRQAWGVARLAWQGARLRCPHARLA
jgi:hypothetical protein